MRAIVVVLTLAGASCAAQHATREQLISRAAFDLDCPAAQLEVVEIDQRTAGVRGCDNRATYVETCDVGASQYGTYQHNCTWMLNSDARPSNEAEPSS